LGLAEQGRRIGVKIHAPKLASDLFFLLRVGDNDDPFRRNHRQHPGHGLLEEAALAAAQEEVLLRYCSRLSGQRRVPLPPARITDT